MSLPFHSCLAFISLPTQPYFIVGWPLISLPTQPYFIPAWPLISLPTQPYFIPAWPLISLPTQPCFIPAWPLISLPTHFILFLPAFNLLTQPYFIPDCPIISLSHLHVHVYFYMFCQTQPNTICFRNGLQQEFAAMPDHTILAMYYLLRSNKMLATKSKVKRWMLMTHNKEY